VSLTSLTTRPPPPRAAAIPCAARGSLPLRDRARVVDVLAGRAPLVGARCTDVARAGLFSPIDARLALGIPYDDLAAEEARYFAERSPARDVSTAARAAVATLLAPPASAVAAPRPFVVSARVDNASVDEALHAILAPLPAHRARLVYFVHAHALNLASEDASFASRLERADLLLPDGIGIRLAARVLGVAMRDNVNGTDLLPLLCREAARRDVPLVLVGGAPNVASGCATRLVASNPGLRIPLTATGFLSDDETASVVAEVRRIGPAVVLVGMGSPRQEAWAEKHLARIPGITVLTVGGLFDFFSGRMPRAPLAVRELGLEWAYRLAQEPRRLASRYLIGNPLFIARAVRQWAGWFG
jgi:N-acetylglucosaminyldiphosphoundecaprenol N-acetyl-beta-D-mannosaminyltransferase